MTILTSFDTNNINLVDFQIELLNASLGFTLLIGGLVDAFPFLIFHARALSLSLGLKCYFMIFVNIS